MALTQVKSDGIATGAVTATQIATGAVTANDLENSGVTAGTYGSSSAIPAITVDAKGRVTSASTSSIDSTAITNGTSNVSVTSNSNVTVVNGGTTVGVFQSDGPQFNDNIKAKFGTGSDLQIYHDGSNSYVQDAGSGNLTLATDGTSIAFQKGSTETLAIFKTDNTCELYYDNAKKLATTSTGINVTGEVLCDSFRCDGDALVLSDTGILTVRDSDDSGNATTNFVQGQNLNGANRWRVGQISTANESLYLTNYADHNIIFATNGTNRLQLQNDGHLRPNVTNTYDLGTSTDRWRNIYTNDLNLSNEGGTNDVDGTWGSWTIQEGEDDLFLLNRRNGKKYKFNLSEVN